MMTTTQKNLIQFNHIEKHYGLYIGMVKHIIMIHGVYSFIHPEGFTF